MKSPFVSLRRIPMLFLVAVSNVFLIPCAVATAEWQAQHDQLVKRLKALVGVEDAFGPSYQPLYHAALPWYEQFGGNSQHDVDGWMVSPEQYATELADALEQGRNYFAEHAGTLIPLVFEQTAAGGDAVRTNYWVSLPAGFGDKGRRFPLIVSLHGSGWLDHPISFVRPRQGTAGGPALRVTPINAHGPWRIDFLNAYLDELIRILPVDVDRVYVEGHSLGGMATWEWALHNPERFAAISPRSAVGEPYRAVRLKHVPSWVILGDNDAVIPSGFSDQMVTALENAGASVRYTLLRNTEHNMPEDFDDGRVVEWYLRQKRSHEQAPRDPLTELGLSRAGFSPWTIIARPDENYWHTAPLPLADLDALRNAARSLFRKANDLGERASGPIFEKRELKTNETTFWLPVPKTLRRNVPAEPTATTLPGASYVRFYFRGPTAKAFTHLADITAEVAAGGHQMDDAIWITWLTIWRDNDDSIAEYAVPLK